MKTFLQDKAHLAAADDTWRVLAGYLGRGATAWRQARQASQTRRMLAAMTEGELRDLGIDRSELSSIAHHPADASRARAKWAC